MSLRLNLLPWRERQRLAALRRFRCMFLCSLFTAFVAVMLVDRLAHQRLERQAQAGVLRQAELQALDERVQQVQRLHAAREDMRGQVQALVGLRAGQAQMPQLLAEVEAAMSQGMQLTRLDLQDGRLQVNGLALSSAVLAQFMRDLQRSPVVHDLELKQVVGRAAGDAFLLIARVSPS